LNLMEYAGDWQPPTTVITRASVAGGKLTVRGTAADNEGIQRVTVNGEEAKPLMPNFAEWEITLNPPADGRLTARAVDTAGNEEARPHTVLIRGGLLQAVAPPPLSSKPEQLPSAAQPGGDAKGLIGRWLVQWQRRSGRAIERPRGMTLEINED